MHCDDTDFQRPFHTRPERGNSSRPGSLDDAPGGGCPPPMEAVEHGPRPRVLLLCGGQSIEHWVSLASGRCCAHAFDRRRWDVEVACILTDGSWLVPKRGLGPKTTSAQIDKIFDVMEYPDFAPKAYANLWRIGTAIEYLLGDGRPDLVFPLTHGPRGEDGTLQGLLDFLGIPYVGSGVMASALAMDKVRTLELMEAHGLPTARRVVVGPGRIPWEREAVSRIVEDRLGWPVFVKPAVGGSSLGAGRAENAAELIASVEHALTLGDTVLVEECIVGHEVTCGVLEIAGCASAEAAAPKAPEESDGNHGGGENGESAPLEGRVHRVVCPPTLIRPLAGAFFDYDSKYSPGASEEITPAPLEKETLRTVQQLADRAHLILGCEGLSRTDFFVTESGRTVYLETNTLPGMTATSLLPQGARAIGLDLTQLLSALADACLASTSKGVRRRGLLGAALPC